MPPSSQISSQPGIVKVSFEFEPPAKAGRYQTISKGWTKPTLAKGLSLPYHNPNQTKRMMVARSIRPSLPRRSVNIKRLEMSPQPSSLRDSLGLPKSVLSHTQKRKTDRIPINQSTRESQASNDAYHMMKNRR